MDFSYAPEEEAFRQEVRDFLEKNLPEGWGTPEYEEPETREEELTFLRDWQRRLYEAGLAGIAWPKEYGGQGASLIEQVIFNEEMARHKAPAQINAIAIGMLGPTIMAHGEEWQKKRFLPKMLSAEEIWSQGFSEPNAGSDVASLTTSAVEDGDEYVINGQKVWLTVAHIASWCMLLVRTDPHAERKHHGLSYFIVDMKSPGVTVRPLVQITGGAEFNEVFFDDVRVPRKNMVAEKNKGWYAAITTLMHERSSIGAGGAVTAKTVIDELVQLAKKTSRHGRPLSEDPTIRQRLAQFYIEVEAMKYNNYRSLTKQLRGEPPGAEGSIGKLFSSELGQRMQELAMEIQGPYSQLLKGSDWTVEKGRWQYSFLMSRGMTIAGGTSEILRNVIGERVLGLPR